MLSHISAFLAVVLAVSASARMERHLHVRNPNDATPPSQCNTGELKCCNTMYNATDYPEFLDALSVPYDMTDNFAMDCTPWDISGGGQSSACQQQPVCCANNHYDGFINVGCSPSTVN